MNERMAGAKKFKIQKSKVKIANQKLKVFCFTFEF